LGKKIQNKTPFKTRFSAVVHQIDDNNTTRHEAKDRGHQGLCPDNTVKQSPRLGSAYRNYLPKWALVLPVLCWSSNCLHIIHCHGVCIDMAMDRIKYSRSPILGLPLHLICCLHFCNSVSLQNAQRTRA
jgi:hypothetical protein